MEQFSGLAPEQQAIAGIAFLVAMGFLAAWSKFRGNKEGAPKPKVQEFYASGSIADMGPVKELVEQTGLLFQQQVKTNITLERLALAVEEAVKAWGEEREQQDREEEIERRVAERLAEEGVPRRRAPRKAD